MKKNIVLVGTADTWVPCNLEDPPTAQAIVNSLDGFMKEKA